MKICFISDTHGSHKGLRNLPEADVICHTGDYSPRGTHGCLNDFLRWFSSLDQYKYRIFISGNHDIFAEDSPDVTLSMIPSNVFYLFDSSIVLDGFKFYGTPWQPIFLDWAFNLSESDLTEKWKLIPSDTDILLTHCPPKNVLDFAPSWYEKPAQHCGSSSLLAKVKTLKPIVHAFGHIHEGYGEVSLYDNISFVNGSVLDGQYRLVNDPIVINAIK
jgi:Icc-related predicted phosphoesterase